MGPRLSPDEEAAVLAKIEEERAAAEQRRLKEAAAEAKRKDEETAQRKVRKKKIRASVGHEPVGGSDEHASVSPSWEDRLEQLRDFFPDASEEVLKQAAMESETFDEALDRVTNSVT